MQPAEIPEAKSKVADVREVPLAIFVFGDEDPVDPWDYLAPIDGEPVIAFSSAI